LTYIDSNCQSPTNLITYYTDTCQTLSSTSSSQYSCTTSSFVMNTYTTPDCSGSVSTSTSLYESLDTCLGFVKVNCNYYPPANEIVSSKIVYSSPNCQGSITWATYLTNTCVPGLFGFFSYSCANNALTKNSYSGSTTCSGTPSSSTTSSFDSGCSSSTNSQQFCGFVAAATRSDIMSHSAICFIAIVYLLLSFIH